MKVGVFCGGAGDRNRTGTGLPPTDFSTLTVFTARPFGVWTVRQSWAHSVGIFYESGPPTGGSTNSIPMQGRSKNAVQQRTGRSAQKRRGQAPPLNQKTRGGNFPKHPQNFLNLLIFECYMVRAVGIEPTLCRQNRILNPARLPVPPRPRHDFL